MKKKLLLLSSLWFGVCSQLTAQLSPLSPLGHAEAPKRTSENVEKTLCGNDEVGYSLAKNLNGNTVSNFAVQANSTGHIGGISQWFDAPSSITIRGVWVLTSAVTQNTTLNVSIHTPLNDSTPGSILATGTLVAPFTSDATWRSVVFLSPVVVNGPYVITVMNPNAGEPNRVRLYSNYTNPGPPSIGSGRGEGLSRASYGGFWHKPNVLYNAFDADWIVEPVVEYTMVSDFNPSSLSACTGEDIVLTNTTTAIAQSRFYNRKKFNEHFNGTANNTFTWTLADGSITNTVDAETTHNTGGNYSISLNVDYNIWVGAVCTSTKSENIDFIPIDDPSFNYAHTLFCTGSLNEAPDITGGSTGTFTSSDPGLIFIDDATGEIDLTNSTPNTYTVTFTTDGVCPDSHSENITISAPFDATFSYASSSYCIDGTNPVPVFTGGSAGVFSATSELDLDSNTGEINLAGSDPGSYTVTNTIATSGGCSSSIETFNVTIIDLDDAGFDYSAASYCIDGSNPVANITGGSTGTFSSSDSGLVFEDNTTGEINLAGSTPDSYTITFTTNGTCPNSETFNVTVIDLDDAGFDYSAASYCIDGSNPVANITGGSTGTFSSSDSGLVFEDNTTGEINLAGSAPDSYTITFTTNGTCPNSETFNVAIIDLDDASFNYDATAYCAENSNPLATITGGATGTFTSSDPGLIFEDNTTGEINLAASTPDSYTITFTTNGTCPNSETFDVVINASPTVTLDNDNILLCVNHPDYTLVGGNPAGGIYTVEGTPATIFQPSVAGVGEYDFVYTYTDANGCTASANGMIEVDGCLGINENSTTVKMFPNPTNGVFTIEANSFITSIEVVNTWGAVVQSNRINANKISINLSSEANGIYFVKITSIDGNSIIEKIELSK